MVENQINLNLESIDTELLRELKFRVGLILKTNVKQYRGLLEYLHEQNIEVVFGRATTQRLWVVAWDPINKSWQRPPAAFKE
jgi:hypothetical protein